jgi:hypothetical protein
MSDSNTSEVRQPTRLQQAGHLAAKALGNRRAVMHKVSANALAKMNQDAVQIIDCRGTELNGQKVTKPEDLLSFQTLRKSFKVATKPAGEDVCTLASTTLAQAAYAHIADSKEKIVADARAVHAANPKEESFVMVDFTVQGKKYAAAFHMHTCDFSEEAR